MFHDFGVRALFRKMMLWLTISFIIALVIAVIIAKLAYQFNLPINLSIPEVLIYSGFYFFSALIFGPIIAIFIDLVFFGD